MWKLSNLPHLKQEFDTACVENIDFAFVPKQKKSDCFLYTSNQKKNEIKSMVWILNIDEVYEV